jgi:PAS domain S-box-containing protein
MEIGWRWDRLSGAEKQVAELLLEGKSNKEICGEMYLSRARVQECIRRIVKKTVADSTRDAIVLLAECRETAALIRVLEQAQDGVAIVQDGVVKFANRSLAKMMGYTAEELVGMHFLELVPPELGDRIRERYERRVRGESAPVGYRTTIIGKDGKRRQISVGNAGPIRFNGRPAFMGIAFAD